jgi:hypothetical protein
VNISGALVRLEQRLDLSPDSSDVSAGAREVAGPEVGTHGENRLEDFSYADPLAESRSRAQRRGIGDRISE